MTTFKMTNRTGHTLYICGQEVGNGSYFDLLPIWAQGQIAEEESDVEGINSGKAINGDAILDIVNEKQSINFVSQTIDHADCIAIKEMAKVKPLTISTDMFSSDEQTYQCYTMSRDITHIVNQYCKVSFTIVEV